MRPAVDHEVIFVTLTVEDRPDGGISVTSEDVPGLLLSGRDPAAIWGVVGMSVERLLRMNKGLDVLRALLPQSVPFERTPLQVSCTVEIAVQLALAAA